MRKTLIWRTSLITVMCLLTYAGWGLITAVQAEKFIRGIENGAPSMQILLMEKSGLAGNYCQRPQNSDVFLCVNNDLLFAGKQVNSLLIPFFEHFYTNKVRKKDGELYVGTELQLYTHSRGFLALTHENDLSEVTEDTIRNIYEKVAADFKAANYYFNSKTATVNIYYSNETGRYELLSTAPDIVVKKLLTSFLNEVTPFLRKNRIILVHFMPVVPEELPFPPPGY